MDRQREKMEIDHTLKVQNIKSALHTQSVLDKEMEEPSEMMGQVRISPQEQEELQPDEDVGNSTATDVDQDVVVKRTSPKKPFSGGYHHKATNTEYRHAGVQTVTRKRPVRRVEMFSRDTQTVQLKNQAQQSTISRSTQMNKPGCYISITRDKLITPGRYVTADEYHSKRLKAVIIIQSYTRRWLAKKLTTQLKLSKKLRLAWMEKVERQKVEEKQERIRDEYYRRMHPEKKEDFAMLYNALENWRKEQEENIKGSLRGAERKRALCALLAQETQYIASIESHRRVAEEKRREKSVQAFLDKRGAPKQWKRADGKMIQMDTPHTIRARELRDLYGSIILKGLSRKKRLDVLLTLKRTVKEHDCKLTREMVRLIDRETDLLTRGVKERNLEGLRKRISTLFLQYIKDPTFNPQVPQDPKQLRKDLHFCRGCRKFLPSSKFPLTANKLMVDFCHHCKKLDKEARDRKDISYYKTILDHLRKDESKLQPNSKIPYLLQEQDIRYLVDVVWGARCALSGSRDLNDLRLVRWDRDREWSPWNCILLNKDMAAAHLKLDNIKKTYAPSFILDIKRKHILAQRHFSQIPRMLKELHDVTLQPVARSHRLVTKPITKRTNRK